MRSSDVSEQAKPTIVFAHGLWADGSCYSKVIPRLLADVYGTLINTPPANLQAFRSILHEASETNVEPMEFYSFWEQRNVAHYMEPYKSYKEICQLSLSEAFRRFGVSSGREELITRYFECFSSMRLYPDVQPTLDILAPNYRLALVSNIDDDLLNMTALGRQFASPHLTSYFPDLNPYLICSPNSVSCCKILNFWKYETAIPDGWMAKVLRSSTLNEDIAEKRAFYSGSDGFLPRGSNARHMPTDHAAAGCHHGPACADRSGSGFGQ